MANTASKLNNKLLKRYKTNYKKLSEDSKKRIDVLDKHEILQLDFNKDVLPQMPALEDDEEKK